MLNIYNIPAGYVRFCEIALVASSHVLAGWIRAPWSFRLACVSNDTRWRYHSSLFCCSNGVSGGGGGGSPSSSSTNPTTTASTTKPTSTSSSSVSSPSSCAAAIYSQCGGTGTFCGSIVVPIHAYTWVGFTGCTACASGSTCKASNQCKPQRPSQTRSCTEQPGRLLAMPVRPSTHRSSSIALLYCYPVYHLCANTMPITVVRRRHQDTHSSRSWNSIKIPAGAKSHLQVSPRPASA
jgi:hypothetical protein